MRSFAAASLLLLFVSTSCKSVKLAKVLKKGSVTETDFHVSVPFEYRMDLVVIEVVIKGKTYHFMVDTGAPNVISEELAAEISASALVSKKTGDSEGAKSELDFITLDTVSIGGLSFINTGAAVASFKQSSEIACLGIDGLIGANLMRKAVWEFDYEKQVISIASGRDKLSIPSDAFVLPFEPVLSGTPKVTVEYNGRKEGGVTFDTGSNGSFSSSDEMLGMLKKDSSELRTTYGFGRNSSGLYGANKGDTTHYALADVKIGEMSVPAQLVTFNASKSNILGTKFFRNYRMILDWSAEEALFIKNAELKPAQQDNYGFTPNRSGDKLTAGFIFYNSKAEKEGMMVGDRILSISGKDYSTLTDEDWCELISSGIGNGEPHIEVTVLRGGEKHTFLCEKKAILKR